MLIIEVTWGSKMTMDIFGHRGATGEAPENTLLGFAHALNSARVQCFELDVHLTKDNQLAVIHDNTLDRTTNGKGYISSFTMKELKNFDARNKFNFSDSIAEIPSLSEVFEIYADKIKHFQIEIKVDSSERIENTCNQIIDNIKNYGIGEKVTVTSFNEEALRCILRKNSTQKCGFIASSYRESALKKAIDLGCCNTCIPIETPDAKVLVKEAHAAGLEVTGWLGNTRKDVETLLEWQVDSITTDYPTQILQFIRNSGLKDSIRKGSYYD